MAKEAAARVMLTKLSDDQSDNNEALYITDTRSREIVMKLQQIDKLKQEIETQLQIGDPNNYQGSGNRDLDKEIDNTGNVTGDTKVSYNSVGQLQELCMKSGLSLPRYNDLGYQQNIGQFKVCSF